MKISSLNLSVGAVFMATLFIPLANAQSLSEVKASVKISSLSLEAAQIAANAALKACQQRGAMVAVAVVDRSGVTLTVLRDTLAGMHTPDTAMRKAWTAVSFKNSTSELAKATSYNQASSGIRQLPNVAMIGGGLLIQESGTVSVFREHPMAIWMMNVQRQVSPQYKMRLI